MANVITEALTRLFPGPAGDIAAGLVLLFLPALLILCPLALLLFGGQVMRSFRTVRQGARPPWSILWRSWPAWSVVLLLAVIPSRETRFAAGLLAVITMVIVKRRAERVRSWRSSVLAKLYAISREAIPSLPREGLAEDWTAVLSWEPVPNNDPAPDFLRYPLAWIRYQRRASWLRLPISPVGFVFGVPVGNFGESVMARLRELVAENFPGQEWGIEPHPTRSVAIVYPDAPVLPDFIEYPADFPHAENWRLFPLGVDQEGADVIWNTLETPWLLDAGTTGAGKSTSVRARVYHAARSPWRPGVPGWRIFLADTKGTELTEYEDKVEWLAKNLVEIREMFAFLWGEFEARQTRVRELRRSGMTADEAREAVIAERGAIYIAVEEVAALFLKDRSDSDANALRRDCESWLAKLTGLGRAFGFHGELNTQLPKREFLNTWIQTNADARIARRVNSPAASVLIIDSPAARHLPSHIKGRALWRGPHGLVEFQSYFTPPKVISDLPDYQPFELDADQDAHEDAAGLETAEPVSLELAALELADGGQDDQADALTLAMLELDGDDQDGTIALDLGAA